MKDSYFNREEVDEILSRKPSKLKFKKKDYQELACNIAHGSIEVVKAVLTIVGLILLTVPVRNDEDVEDGYRDGSQGYGHYINDVRVDLDEDC